MLDVSENGERGKIMRTICSIGSAAIAASIFLSSAAFAWTAEAPVQGQGQGQGPAAVDLSDNDNFKALQDKLNGTASLSQSGSGFTVYGGMGSGSEYSSQANPYGVQPLTGRNSGFSYSPNPGFRGLPQ